MSQRSNFLNTLVVIAGILLVFALAFIFLQNKNSENPKEDQNTVDDNIDDQDNNQEPLSFTSLKGAKLILKNPKDIDDLICPIKIDGQMENKGWFFEAAFPIQLLDSNGEIIESSQATAKGEWTTDGLVEFSSIMYCQISDLSGYTLKFMADNAAGLPELDDSIEINL